MLGPWRNVCILQLTKIIVELIYFVVIIHALKATNIAEYSLTPIKLKVE